MATEKMSLDQIEREVLRLAPWYYQFDLHGVRTDTTLPGDRYGHRTISPQWGEGIVEGKTVLDVGCNEGYRSFVSLDNGAARTIAFQDIAVLEMRRYDALRTAVAVTGPALLVGVILTVITLSRIDLDLPLPTGS